MASFVRWIKVRTSGRGRSKDQPREGGSSPQKKEMPHPSECSIPLYKSSDIRPVAAKEAGQLPDVLAHSSADIDCEDDEDLLQLQRNAPLRRTLPPIPLDQSPYKPGLSSETRRGRPRSCSMDVRTSPNKPAPVYEEIPNWALDDSPAKARCAPYLVVTIPGKDAAENLIEDEELSLSGLKLHRQVSKDTPTDTDLSTPNPAVLYTYRYSCSLQDPDNIPEVPEPVAEQNVVREHFQNQTRVPSPIIRVTPTSHAADHDSVDECYEYDMDSSCGQCSELSSPARDDDDDLLSGVYPLHEVKGHKRSGVRRGSRSQSDSSNDTFSEYDGASEPSYQDDVARVQEQLLFSRQLSENNVMMKGKVVQPYVMTTICEPVDVSHNVHKAVSEETPPLPPRMRRQHSTPNYHKRSPREAEHHARGFLSPPVQRKVTQISQETLFDAGHLFTSEAIFRSASPNLPGAFAYPQQDNVFRGHAKDICTKCGHTSDGEGMDSAGHMSFAPHRRHQSQPRPTLGVSAMCIKKNQQAQGGSSGNTNHFLKVRNMSEDFDVLRSMPPVPERNCRTRQPIRGKSRTPSPFLQQHSKCDMSSIVAEVSSHTTKPMTSHNDNKSRGAHKMAASGSRDHNTSKSRLRTDQPRHNRHHAASQQSKHNRQHAVSQQNKLLQDLMQVNFDRQNLATS